MKQLRERVAVVTGAGDGIGRALALALTEAGCRLALCGRTQSSLEETRTLCEKAGGIASVHVVDVSDRAGMFAFADEVVALHGAVHVVVNNAGVGLGATVEGMTFDELEWLLGINMWGVVHGVKAFLPHLRRAGEGHIVNVSSILGMIAIPTQGAYNMAKFAIRGMSESLRQELRIEGANIGVTSVQPGFIRTSIAARGRVGDLGPFGVERDEAVQRFQWLAQTSPERVARKTVEGIRRNKARVLVGVDAHAVDLMQRLFPSFYQDLTTMGARFLLKPGKPRAPETPERV